MTTRRHNTTRKAPTREDVADLRLDIAGLIRLRKGDPRHGGYTYEGLVARRPIDPETGRPYGPDIDQIQKMVREPLLEMPKPRTMQGLAVMLDVLEVDVLDSCARSCKMHIRRSKGRFVVSLPPEVDDLPDAVQDTLLDQIRMAVALHAAASAAQAGTPKGTGRRRRGTTSSAAQHRPAQMAALG